MKPYLLTIVLLVAPLTGEAITMSAGDSFAADKIRYMQKASGTDQSLMAAYVQTDQAYSQWCGKSASVKVLKRIAAQDSFNSIYQSLKQGRPLGMTQVRAVLISNNQNFCKD
ncbi:hypothetical protein SMZ65_004372 [Cronobacter dublinensis]|nr:hypothetical protein [Cronobacter dublinensis]ELY4410079.1 hypothetical protein [Cronobacter dublinensis]ELY4487620.1 hypothetical protein [Cronobacter dublinensis]